MNCTDFQKLLSARLDDELCEEHGMVLAPHLAKCDQCRIFQEDLVRCVTVLDSLPLPSARPGFTDRVMSQLPEQTIQFAWRSRLLPVSPIRVGFGSLGLACGVAMAILMVGTQEMKNTSGAENLEQGGIDYSEVFAATPANSIGGRFMSLSNEEGK